MITATAMPGPTAWKKSRSAPINATVPAATVSAAAITSGTTRDEVFRDARRAPFALREPGAHSRQREDGVVGDHPEDQHDHDRRQLRRNLQSEGVRSPAEDVPGHEVGDAGSGQRHQRRDRGTEDHADQDGNHHHGHHSSRSKAFSMRLPSVIWAGTGPVTPTDVPGGRGAAPA